MVVLVDDVSTRLMLVVELSSTLVLVGSSRLEAVGPFRHQDDTFELGVVPMRAGAGVVTGMVTRCQGDSTRSRAAATAVNTPIIFSTSRDLLVGCLVPVSEMRTHHRIRGPSRRPQVQVPLSRRIP